MIICVIIGILHDYMKYFLQLVFSSLQYDPSAAAAAAAYGVPASSAASLQAQQQQYAAAAAAAMLNAAPYLGDYSAVDLSHPGWLFRTNLSGILCQKVCMSRCPSNVL